MSGLDIRWGTDLVTFFDPGYWGLPADLAYSEWDSAVTESPRSYFERMLDDAAEVGLSGVELAPAPGGWVNAVRAYGGTTEFGAALADHGLVLSSSYVLPTWLTDVLGAADDDQRDLAERDADDQFRRHAEFVRTLGCDTVITSTVPRGAFSDVEGIEAEAETFQRPADQTLLERVAEQLNRLGQVTSEFEVHVAIHTDAYSLCSRTDDVDRLMALTDPGTVRLCPDAGHITLDDGDPLEIVRRHGHRSPVLHWKDCACPLAPHTLSGPPMVRHDVMIKYFRLMGTGLVDWHEWVRILRDSNWSGWGIAEIDMSPNPKAEILAGLDYFARELAPIASDTAPSPTSQPDT